MANPSTGPPSSVVESINSDAISVTYWPRVLAAARSNRLGHQGLPVERLDVNGPWSDPMGTDGTVPWNNVTNTALIGGLPPSEYTAAYHSRNRLYLPDWGRFSASDPNGTGLPVLDEMTYGGMAISVSSTDADYLAHYADGMNVHIAYGLSPLGDTDPLGLYGIEDSFEDSSDVMNWMSPIPGPGDYISSVRINLVSEYELRLDWDVDWAADWSMSDHWHSRLDSQWVTIAIGGGLYQAFDLEIPGSEEAVNPLDVFAQAASGPRGTGPVRDLPPRTVVNEGAFV